MVAAALLLALAVAPGSAADWSERVDWPLVQYASDLAEGEGRSQAGLLELDAATAILLKVSVESDLGGRGYRVHNLGGKTVSVPYREARDLEPARLAALKETLERHRSELSAPPSPAAALWLAEQSAAMAAAVAVAGGGPEAVLADWRFFGFRRGGVVDLPGLGTRSRAQTLKMLRALAPGGAPARPDARRAQAWRAVWLRAQASAHETQYLLTGEQVRRAALELYPALGAWAGEAAPREDELPWTDLLALARTELRPAARGRPGVLWMALDANAARLLADAAVLLGRRGIPPSARPEPPAAPGARLFSDVTSSKNFLLGSRDALDVVTAGAAVLDFDLDGLPDLMIGYAVARGGTLWRNVGEMRFELVPGALGEGGQRAAPIDFDGDGWTDLLVLGDNESATRLLRNDRGRFTDVGGTMGFSPPRGIVESGVWFDADGDGDLDLYLVYLGRTIDRVGPAADGLNGSPNVFYINDGGRLREATEGSGLEDGRWGWAATALDYDSDGRDDILLCNLWGRSRLFHSLGGGRFEDATARAGLEQANLCRGAASADVDGDGRSDLFLSASTMPQDLYSPFSGAESALVDQAAFTQGYGGGAGSWQEDALYLNAGGGRFRAASSTTLEGRTGMSWSGLLDDLDLDGVEDLYVVNGFYPDTLFFHDERKVLRLGSGDGSFWAAPAGNGADFLGTSRASLTADFDRDGCPDLLVTGLHGPRLLKGSCPTGRSALRLRLSQPGPNPDAVGASVELSAGGRRRTLRWGPYGGGQLSSFWGERLVGLGSAGAAQLTVTWPGGARESFGPFKAGVSAVLRRGDGRR